MCAASSRLAPGLRLPTTRSLGGLGFDQQSILERDLRRAKAMLEDEFLGARDRVLGHPLAKKGPTGPASGRAERVS